MNDAVTIAPLDEAQLQGQVERVFVAPEPDACDMYNKELVYEMLRRYEQTIASEVSSALSMQGMDSASDDAIVAAASQAASKYALSSMEQKQLQRLITNKESARFVMTNVKASIGTKQGRIPDSEPVESQAQMMVIDASYPMVNYDDANIIIQRIITHATLRGAKTAAGRELDIAAL